MDTQTLLIVIAISALVLIAGLIIAFKSQAPRSIDIKFPPQYHIGERIVVNFDANEPKHYRMEL